MPKFTVEERKRIYLMLLENGKQLFNTKGFYEVTAEEIAILSGIAKGTFYHFFENKEHIYMVINNQLQEIIFSNVREMLRESDTIQDTEKFYMILCFIMDEFIKNPLIMEIDAKVWGRIEEKAPKECLEENNVRDLELLNMINKSGLSFRYDLECTTRILQMQFVQLAYIKKETKDFELMKIILRALAEHLIEEKKA